MTQVDTVDTVGLGNTSSRPIRGRGWVFTLNNYTEDEMTHLHSTFGGGEWVVGKEVGDEGTPHLQGFVYFKSARTFASLKKKWPRCHIEKAKGSKKQNFDYCTKDGDYTTNIDFRKPKDKLRDLCLKEYKGVVWKDWQQQVIDLLHMKPDSRSIYWFWEETGNVGKSFLCKYLALTADVIICEGKKSDIFNQINTAIDAGKVPNIIICDVPRTSIDYINYAAIEEIKNGLLYSGKYEGGQCVFPCPHVIIFANTEPHYYKVSKDRWKVTHLTGGVGGAPSGQGGSGAPPTPPS